MTWLPDKRFGFIKEDGQPRGEVFVHENQITKGAPYVDAAVTFEADVRGSRKRLVALWAEIEN